jgi:hypothetical protein
MSKGKPMTAQRKRPLSELPKNDTKAGLTKSFALFGLLRTRLRGFFSTSECGKLMPGALCIPSEEPQFQGELLLTMPTNMQPTRLVIVGDWGDSYPEVQLVQLKNQ